MLTSMAEWENITVKVVLVLVRVTTVDITTNNNNSNNNYYNSHDGDNRNKIKGLLMHKCSLSEDTLSQLPQIAGM